ncbi:MAG TPA: hypothetical protein VII37_04955 [Candidatus Acidoferrum sp.]
MQPRDRRNAQDIKKFPPLHVNPPADHRIRSTECIDRGWLRVACLQSRLSFIFGAAVFSVVFFRHLPELGLDVDIILLARRGLLLIVSLFALFCFTLELERVANAFGNNRQA